VRVQLVDPPAYTPPYDHSLAAALAAAGADVELVTSRFRHGPVPEAAGYRVREHFYRRAAARDLPGRAGTALKLAEHMPDMLRYRRVAAAADVVHYQWLPVPVLDARLLPPRRPRVLTAHNVIPHEPSGSQVRALRRVTGAMDAVIVHSEPSAVRAVATLGLSPDRLHVIPHGAFDYLTRVPRPVPLPAELAAVEGSVILCFGLMRHYKGIDVLLEAAAQVEGAEIWVVGRPMIPLEPLRQLAARAGGRVRIVPRFVTDPEIPAFLERASLVVLPYREIDQSGVLYTALAFGKPLVLSAVGGFVEVAEQHGAARLVPPGDAQALTAVLNELLEDGPALEALAAAARRAAVGPYSWRAVSERTLALYERLLEARA